MNHAAPVALAQPVTFSAGATSCPDRPLSALIVVRNDVESPAPGRWTIPPQTIRARFGATWTHRTRVTVQGALVIDETTSVTLETVPDASRRPQAPEFRFRGILVSSDRLGRWRFHGTASSGGIAYELTIRIIYHGVFRSGPHGVTWLAIAGAESNIDSHLKRAGHRRLVRGLTGGLNAILEGRDGAHVDAVTT